MKKGTKIVGIILGTIAILLIIVVAISYTNHRLKLVEEDKLFVPNGKMVQVNKHKVHTYTEGQGKETLVFMSGGGTSSPVLDFKSLYDLLIDKYRIVVIEKSGYGFSEDADLDRDIDTILGETRRALSESGLNAPYILFPHSMSGIEALYWVQQYPEEVKGIIGLDMAVPEAYEDYSINHFMLNLSSFGARIGITRFFPSIVDDSAAIKHGTLTEEEKELYRVIFYRRTLTKSMFKEIKDIKSNAEKVKQNGKPDVPILLFTSNGHGTGWDKSKWKEFQTSYIKDLELNKQIKLDCGHYVHNIEYDKIAEESKQFIEDIIDKN